MRLHLWLLSLQLPCLVDDGARENGDRGPKAAGAGEGGSAQAVAGRQLPRGYHPVGEHSSYAVKGLGRSRQQYDSEQQQRRWGSAAKNASSQSPILYMGGEYYVENSEVQNEPMIMTAFVTSRDRLKVVGVTAGTHKVYLLKLDQLGLVFEATEKAASASEHASSVAHAGAAIKEVLQSMPKAGKVPVSAFVRRAPYFVGKRATTKRTTTMMTPMMRAKTPLSAVIVYVDLRVPAQGPAAATFRPRKHQQKEEGPRVNTARGAQ